MYTEYILIYIFGHKPLQGTHTVIKANIEKKHKNTIGTDVKNTY